VVKGLRSLSIPCFIDHIQKPKLVYPKGLKSEYWGYSGVTKEDKKRGQWSEVEE
jgi:hypothetical protein